MCTDLTITTEHGLIYHLTHVGGGLRMTCNTDTAPGLLLDQHVDGFTAPQVGWPIRFLGSELITPPVETVTRG